MHILVVDDEESIRRYVHRVLSEAGHRTTIAVDCAGAIAAAAESRFDLLLTDVMMPEMTGAELAVRLRQNDPDLKVLYLTGYSDRLFDAKGTLDQQEAFLEKPCSAAALRQAVSLAVTGRVTTSVLAPGTVGAAPAMGGDHKIRHDFKNQLAIIRGFAEILLAEAAGGDPRRPDYEEIHKAAMTALDVLARSEPSGKHAA